MQCPALHRSSSSFEDTLKRRSSVLSVSDENLPPTQPLSSPEEEETNPPPLKKTTSIKESRSFLSQKFVHFLSCTSPSGTELKIRDVTYLLLNRNIKCFTEKPLACCGCTPNREIILLNPKQSPLLDAHFQRLMKTIVDQQKTPGQLCTTQQLLNHVKTYVKDTIFFKNQEGNIIAAINKIFQDAVNNPSIDTYKHSEIPNADIPAISLERYISEGVGVCRQCSLTVCYLLNRLGQEPVKNPILEGYVQHRRGSFNSGVHSWTFFVSKKEPLKQWVIDVPFDVVETFADPLKRGLLSKYDIASKGLL